MAQENPHPLVGRKAIKMNGAGNEIVVLDLRDGDYRLTGEDARAIGRSEKLAFDQLMILYPPQGAKTVASMKIFNRDGSLSGSCGNGTRCVARIVMGANDQELRLDSDGGLLRVVRESADTFTVNMGAPRLKAEDIPLAEGVQDSLQFFLAPPLVGAPKMFAAVSMGNPHAIFFVENVDEIDLRNVGPKIETHPMFPERTNVSFAQILARDHIKLRVWERGAGATLACGTAACASLVAAVRLKLADRNARVSLPGGDLTIAWRADTGDVLMTGPTEIEAEVMLDDIFSDAAHPMDLFA